MKLTALALIASAAFLISSVQGEMPLSFAAAMNNAGVKDVLAVRNYDTGATLAEEYTDLEHLERKTTVTSWGGLSSSSKSAGSSEGAEAEGAEGGSSGSGGLGSIDAGMSGGGLEASINSNVIGQAHIAWHSFDPSTTINGRHPLIGRSVEDLTGVFSIEKFIQLWSGSTPGEISVDWLPCS